MKNPYFKNEVVKMGVWSLPPGDCETWHGEYTNRYFKQLFGVPKDSMLIYEFSKGFQHAYVTKKYFAQLYWQIDKIRKANRRALEKKLLSFYPLVEAAKKSVAKSPKYPKELSNRELAKEFNGIRNLVHRLSIFDQFAWLGEEYWTPKMENILVNKLGLNKDSEEYNRVLFILTKPEKISTTLLEKKAVTGALIKIKEKRTNLKLSAQKLAKEFGFLPVFCYGDPWLAHHYGEELTQALSKPLKTLREEYKKLKNYTLLRNQELRKIVREYKIEPKDLQIFTDFGLTVDTRNEAEYFVSFAGFYLLPLYKEIARRLYLTTTQVRFLTQKEMLDSLLGKTDPQKILEKRKRFIGWGFSENFSQRIDFTETESEKLFKHIESYVKIGRAHV